MKEYVNSVAQSYAEIKVNEVKNEMAKVIDHHLDEVNKLKKMLEQKNIDFKNLEETYLTELNAIKNAHISGTLDSQVGTMIQEFNQLRATDQHIIDDLKQKNLELEKHLNRKK